MSNALTPVPAQQLDDLMDAVDRFEWLQQECHSAPATYDPTFLLGALADIYEASHRLLQETPSRGES